MGMEGRGDKTKSDSERGKQSEKEERDWDTSARERRRQKTAQQEDKEGNPRKRLQELRTERDTGKVGKVARTEGGTAILGGH